MAEIDSLEIKIKSEASSVNRSITTLIGHLEKLSKALNGINTNTINNFATGVDHLANSMTNFKNSGVATADFTRLAANISKLANLNTSGLAGMSSAMISFGNAVNRITNTVSAEKTQALSDLANAINRFGYKSAVNAIDNIPRLAVAMNELMTTLSKAPKVSNNLIAMTNALANFTANLKGTGTVSQTTAKSFKVFDKAADTSRKKAVGLASAIGKLYAKYFLLFRAFGKLRDAVNISSDITEVQNVVEKSFGNYADKVEDLVANSINDFGMSELTVKQVSSRFQAMGMAMGFAQDNMADMSVTLTKLTADMASFYNVDQKDVAEDLASIFTGTTKPLRQYGIDLTEANMKQWALKQGIDANIESMTGAEKAMLRYKYVLAQTERIQGDFRDTQMTWANQTRILKENIKEFGKVVGTISINSLKPLVMWLNQAILALTKFATVVAESLGTIFGWQYEKPGGAIVNVGESVEDLGDDLDDATASAKKLKRALASFDELNVLTSNDKGGRSGGGLGDIFDFEYNEGGWKKTEGLIGKYSSELYTLYQLGDKVAEVIRKGLEKIKWGNVFAGARDFGAKLANFLNGLVNKETFSKVGETIANSLNTAIIASVSFGEHFDSYGLGESIAEGLNNFLETFDFKELAKGLNVFVDNLEDFIGGFLKNFKWSDALKAAGDFLGNLEIDTIAVVVGFLAIKNIGKVSLGASAIAAVSTAVSKGMATAFAGIGGISNFLTLDMIALANEGGLVVAGSMIASALIGSIVSAIGGFNLGSMISEAILKDTDKTGMTGSEKASYLWDSIWNKKDFGDALRQWLTDVMTGELPYVKVNLGDKIRELGDDLKLKIKGKFDSIKEAVILKTILFIQDIEKYFTVAKWTFNGIKEGIEKSFNNAVIAAKAIWNTFADWLNEHLKFEIPEFNLFGKNIWQSFTIDLGKIPKFATGGFPEDGLFMANHNEIVGNFANGQTAVANNTQIENGIEEAAYRGFMRAMNENGGFSTNVTLQGDAKKFFTAVQGEARSYTARTGKAWIPN